MGGGGGGGGGGGNKQGTSNPYIFLNILVVSIAGEACNITCGDNFTLNCCLVFVLPLNNFSEGLQVANVKFSLLYHT